MRKQMWDKTHRIKNILYLLLFLVTPMLGCPASTKEEVDPSSSANGQGPLFPSYFSSELDRFCAGFEYIDRRGSQISKTPYQHYLCLIPEGFLLVPKNVYEALTKAAPKEKVKELYTQVHLFKYQTSSGWMESHLAKFPEDIEIFSRLISMQKLDPNYLSFFKPAKTRTLEDSSGKVMATLSFQTSPAVAKIQAAPSILKNHPEEPLEIQVTHIPTQNQVCVEMAASLKIRNRQRLCQKTEL